MLRNLDVFVHKRSILQQFDVIELDGIAGCASVIELAEIDVIKSLLAREFVRDVDVDLVPFAAGIHLHERWTGSASGFFESYGECCAAFVIQLQENSILRGQQEERILALPEQ